MKRFSLLITFFLLSLPLSAQNSWYGDKYSLFVHYGLYSIPAGVFDGKKVERGYSEQILTFGIGFSDWYEAYAREFTADRFDADSIVALAKEGGMRSVIMTSKHHDGFCLFNTATTPYNVMNTPARRDLIAELSDACHRQGMGFGVYFSLIDWHYPYAVPFSSHNADPITPEHHSYNMAQVRELLTQYGKIDEIWFDMGSLTALQSAKLYALVHELQPECMVSGRLGNDYADFCVMADNEYPDYRMAVPWQTAASMFDETWGYRSWQERGTVEDKVKEKLAALLKVVSYGGKYLLNIGPMGNGAIVPFEAEVVRRIGEEIDPIKMAVYDTFPAAEGDHWATLSADRCTKFHIIPKGEPHPKGTRYVATNSYYNIYGESVTQSDLLAQAQSVRGRISPLNGTPLFAHSSADYYASFRSIIGYSWYLPESRETHIYYTDAEVAREITINGESVRLQPEQSQWVTTPLYEWGEVKEAPQKGRLAVIANSPDWQPSDVNLVSGVQLDLGFSQGQLYSQSITTRQVMDLPLEITYSDGILIYLNGIYIDGAIHRPGGNGEVRGHLSLLLPLKKGDNTLTIKLYNRWNRGGYLQLHVPERWRRHRQSIELTAGEVKLSKPMIPPFASPAHLSSLRIR